MTRHTPALLAIILTVFWVTGCGGSESTDSETAANMEQTEAPAEPAGTASITGTIHLDGTPPEREPLDVDRECLENRDGPPLSEAVVANEDGTLRWVFVYVKEGLGDRSFPVPQEPVELDQEGCMYTPHVVGLQVGQPIKIRNSDPFQHNIHAMPEENRPFNFSQPVAGMEQEQTFREPEVMVRIKCDVHPWMLAWAGVVDHPYHAVTGEDGTFSLEGLPAGEYVIETWHEEYGTQTQTVTVGDGESATADFTYAVPTS